MKTDRVLTTDECLNEWGAVLTPVDPPACDARHVPITEGKDVHPATSARSCNCDRWGHPCPSCTEPKIQPRLELATSLPAKQLTQLEWNA
jgi:hypothetical protein